MSWFNEVTGTNDYERQSWRDSYNGGRAAGDLTGATNARLDSERERFQGATWSGSSSQYSALELAQSGGGAGHGGGNGGASGGVVGPASEVVTQGPVVPGRPAGGNGAGSRLTISGPFTPTEADEVTQFRVGGVIMRPHRSTSNMEEVETRWGDAEFLSPAWFASWAIAGMDVSHNVGLGLGFKSEKFANDVGALGGVFRNNYFDNSASVALGRTADDPWWEVNASARRGGDGLVYRTGGGF